MRALKTSFLAGNSPGKVDEEMFKKISNKSLIGYPLTSGWYSTVSMFHAGVRESW